MNLLELHFHKSAALTHEALKALPMSKLKKLDDHYYEGLRNVERALTNSVHMDAASSRLSKLSKEQLMLLKAKADSAFKTSRDAKWDKGVIIDKNKQLDRKMDKKLRELRSIQAESEAKKRGPKYLHVPGPPSKMKRVG